VNTRPLDDPDENAKLIEDRQKALNALTVMLLDGIPTHPKPF
jgi:hypothetical protein